MTSNEHLIVFELYCSETIAITFNGSMPLQFSKKQNQCYYVNDKRDNADISWGSVWTSKSLQGEGANATLQSTRRSSQHITDLSYILLPMHNAKLPHPQRQSCVHVSLNVCGNSSSIDHVNVCLNMQPDRPSVQLL